MEILGAQCTVGGLELDHRCSDVLGGSGGGVTTLLLQPGDIVVEVVTKVKVKFKIRCLSRWPARPTGGW